VEDISTYFVMVLVDLGRCLDPYRYQKAPLRDCRYKGYVLAFDV